MCIQSILLFVCLVAICVWPFATPCTIACQVPLSMGFSRAHVAMPFSRGSSWPRDWMPVYCGSLTVCRFFTAEPPGKPKEGLALKNWYFQTMALEKTLESPLNFKEVKPVNPKRNQSWIIIGRTDAQAETPILWPPDAKDCLIRKDLDDGKVRRQEEKVVTEDEMVGWHHWLNGHEFE